MTNSENKDLTIEQAIRTLERARWLKRNSIKEDMVRSRALAGDFSAFTPVNSLPPSLSQINSVLKASAEILRMVSSGLRQEMRANPWSLLAKIAIGSFGVGLLAACRVSLRSRARL